MLIDRYAQARKLTARIHLEYVVNFKHNGEDHKDFLEEVKGLYRNAKVDMQMKLELLQTALEGTKFPLDVLILSSPTSYE